jgi:hypothetical protein
MALGDESSIYSSIGTTLSVSATTPATYDDTGFAALTFTEVGLVGSISSFGGSTEVSTFNVLKSGNTVKRKGFTDFGTITIGMARVSDDDGQVLLKSGFDGADKGKVFSYKLEHPAGTGLTQYGTCIVTSYTTDPQAIVQAETSLELDNAVIDVVTP